MSLFLFYKKVHLHHFFSNWFLLFFKSLDLKNNTTPPHPHLHVSPFSPFPQANISKLMGCMPSPLLTYNQPTPKKSTNPLYHTHQPRSLVLFLLLHLTNHWGLPLHDLWAASQGNPVQTTRKLFRGAELKHYSQEPGYGSHLSVHRQRNG